VINVSGTMTSLGASIITRRAIEAMAEIAPQWIEVEDLQRKVSRVIAESTGAEAGFVTASCAAGITLSVAGTITGTDLLAIETLPQVRSGLRREVILQAGHNVNYGAPVDQLIRMAGGTVVLAGTATGVLDYHVANAITEATASVLHVVSHHVSPYHMLPLEEVIAICRPHGVPVIVDAASEYDLRGFLDAGADLVIYSGHKFLSGPTSGIVAGRKDLVRAAFLQNRGIGRGMKVGKETIYGCMAALEAWADRDHSGIRAREEAALELWRREAATLPGLEADVEPDPTGNPLDRLRLTVRRESGYSAAGLARALARGTPPVIVRDHESELGFFYLDPCNLHPGEAEMVVEALHAALSKPRGEDAMIRPDRSSTKALVWPD
jgi:L-seryl-tRNA(Ser) seleniumtransferase